MFVITSGEMKNLEKRATEDFSITEDILMERAGISVVQAMWSEFGDLSQKSFVVICGIGNNGGDGYVVARDVLNYTEAVKVIALDYPITESAKRNYERYLKHGGIFYAYKDLSIEEVSKIISEADIVVDAIFGTGLSRDINDENITRLIEIINIYSKQIVSVDIPSGVSADTGRIMGCAVQSDLTVTFSLPKPGHFLFPGRELTGKLKIAKIGIPELEFLYHGVNRYLLTPEQLIFPERPRWANKSTFSQVVVIGGSEKYIGAPVLTALAAQRSGASMVKLVSIADVCQCAFSHDPSLICVNVVGWSNLKKVYEFFETVKEDTVFVVGPGWDVDSFEEKCTILEKLIRMPNPVIIDADGLNIIAGKTDILKKKALGKTIIITPHPGEFSKLSRREISEVKQNYGLVEGYSKEYGIITILKDATSIISDGKSTYFNITGNTSLSKAGSGDILSGIIGALIAQHLEPLDAAKTAVYTFGIAGEIVPVQGMNSAYEVLNNIPKAFKDISNNKHLT
ncbi:NAD(P)H-hydrate epimerase [Fervidobacterium sp.]